MNILMYKNCAKLVSLPARNSIGLREICHFVYKLSAANTVPQKLTVFNSYSRAQSVVIWIKMAYLPTTKSCRATRFKTVHCERRIYCAGGSACTLMLCFA